MKPTTSIKSRLVKGLMLIVLFFLVQASLAWYAVSNAKSTVVENTRRNTIATSELGSLAILAQKIRRYEKEYFVYVGNKEKRDTYEREWRDALAKIDTALARIKTGSDGAFNANDIERANAWSNASAFYASEMQKIFLAVAERSVNQQLVKEAGAVPDPSAKPGSAVAVERVATPVAFRPIEVNDMIQSGKDKFSTELINGVAAMEKVKTAETLALAGFAEKMFNNVLAGVLMTVVIGTIVALMLSITLPKAVTKTIDSLSSAAHEMSLGNLDNAYDSGGVTEFDKLAESLNRLRMGQQALVERLQRGR